MRKMVLLPYDKYQRLLHPPERNLESIEKPISVEKPITLEEPISTEESIENQTDITNSLPLTLRSKAKTLLEHLKSHSKLNWNRRGEISFGGKTIPGSNVIDLVKVHLRDYKDFKPIGEEQFTHALLESNVPLSLLAPSKRRQTGSGRIPPPPGIPKKFGNWIEL